jgi:hypothetical protein
VYSVKVEAQDLTICWQGTRKGDWADINTHRPKGVDFPEKRLWSLWDMLTFYAEHFVSISRALSGVRSAFKFPIAKSRMVKRAAMPVIDSHRKKFSETLQLLKNSYESINLEITIDQLDRIIRRLSDANYTYGQAERDIENLESRMADELKRKHFLSLSSHEAEIFKNPRDGWDEVINKYPNLTTDLEEASKCLAIGIDTACVFHLMRVMEAGLQLFGGKIGVTFPEDKVWQVILDQANKAIKAMPEKTGDEKRFKSTYAELSAHLYNVKLAWRNNVMHPKESYKHEEAEEITRDIKKFMRYLVVEILT